MFLGRRACFCLFQFLTILTAVLFMPRAANAVDCTVGVSGAISALPKTIHLGRPSVLSWYITEPVGCYYYVYINGTLVADTTFVKSGTMEVTPAVTTEYVLSYEPGPIITSRSRAVTPAGSTTVQVNSNVVRIKGSSAYWKDILINAVGQDGTRVIIEPSVNMDLTGYATPIYIREGVILSSDDGTPPHAMRDGRRLGPVIFTKSRPKPLFDGEMHE